MYILIHVQVESATQNMEDMKEGGEEEQLEHDEIIEEKEEEGGSDNDTKGTFKAYDLFVFYIHATCLCVRVVLLLIMFPAG